MEATVMFSERDLRNLVAAAATVLAMAATARAADPFTLTSTTFKDGQMMPRKVANSLSNNPNCVGQNVSPQLSWTGVPEGTKRFAILMADPEGRAGACARPCGTYGISTSLSGLAQGTAGKLSA